MPMETDTKAHGVEHRTVPGGFSIPASFPLTITIELFRILWFQYALLSRAYASPSPFCRLRMILIVAVADA